MLSGSSLSAASGPFKAQVLGVFYGITDTNHASEDTLGLEYEYPFTPAWGAGLIWEKTPELHDDLHTGALVSNILAFAEGTKD
ncbi:hypothetical protein GCM10027098_13810 [Bowmanella dokdonensis]